MSEPVSHQSNPFSTGGGGVNFETRIQAAFTILMLTGRIAPYLPPWPITRLKLQGLYAGFNTDDFIVYVNHPHSSLEAKLLAQIKHEISFTEGNETFKSVISSAWNDFGNSTIFNADRDALVLITGPLSAQDINHVRPILEWARHAEDEKEFLAKMNTDQFSSSTKKAKLNVFRTHLDTANNNKAITDRQLWSFLKVFHILGFDLDTDTGGILILLQSLIAQYSQEHPEALWSMVVNAVQAANQNAGTITITSLPISIQQAFKSRSSHTWDTDIKKLHDHGAYIINGIGSEIGSTHINRSILLSQLIDVSTINSFVFIKGERGSGKSSLMRTFFEKAVQHEPKFCLRTEDLDKAHLDQVFISLGLKSSLSDLEIAFALIPKKYLFIESIEKLLELEYKEAFKDLLFFLQKNTGWTVIVTGRDYAYQQIIFDYIYASNLTYSTVSVSALTDDEVNYLCREIQVLNNIGNNQVLRPLLKLPFFADLAYKVVTSGRLFTDSAEEKDFRSAVWRNVIAKENRRVNGMPLKRKQAFIAIAVARAKRMTYGVPERQFDPEVVIQLENDALLRRDPKQGLISPAHDILEDWALEQYIEDIYQETFEDIEMFLDTIGHEPAINRAFRLWIQQKLIDDPNFATLILAIISHHKIQSHWRDTAILSILQSQEPSRFLLALQKDIFIHDGEMLKRFLFMLRIACKIPENNISTSEDSLSLIPYGKGWDAVITFLLINKNHISTKLIPHIIAVLDEWSILIRIDEDLPAISREAGLLALWILKYSNSSDRDKENRQKLFQIIIRTVPVISDEFNDLLETDIFIGQSNYSQHFSTIALSNSEAVFLSKYNPKITIRLALHAWLIDEARNNNYQGVGDQYKSTTEHFGINDHHKGALSFPASGYKGPFHALLRFHWREGLDFILQLLNRSVETYYQSVAESTETEYRGYEDEEPIEFGQVEIWLNDGTIIQQYSSKELWMGYCGESRIPTVLQSALMALENWLIKLAESDSHHDDLEWLFDHIVRHSNSVATTSVLISVAIGFWQKIGHLILPFLRIPIFYELDHERARSLYSDDLDLFATSSDAWRRLYAEERRLAAQRSWRQHELEDIIIQLQGSSLQQKVFSIIDELHEKLLENMDWTHWFNRIDSRNWTRVEDVENNRILLYPPPVELELVEHQEKVMADIQVRNRFSRLSIWANKKFRYEYEENLGYIRWEEALMDAKALLAMLEESDSNQENDYRFYRGGIVTAAALFLRDSISEMDQFDVSWCIQLVFSAIMANADSHGVTRIADNGGEAAASVIPMLLEYVKDKDVYRIKQTMIIALTHPDKNIRFSAAQGIQLHLWQHDSKLANHYLMGMIEYARLQQDRRNLRRESLSLYKEQQINWHNDFREQLIQDTFDPIPDVNSMSFESYNPPYLISASLMIPMNTIDSRHIEFLSRLIHLFFDSRVDPTNPYRDDRIKIDDNSFSMFIGYLADYLIYSIKLNRYPFIEQLRSGCSVSPYFMDRLLLHMAFKTEQLKCIPIYWNLWNQLSATLKGIALELIQQSHREQKDQRSILIRRILKTDVPWQKVDYERQDILYGKESILDFVHEAGENPDVFESMAALIYHFPPIFFKSGICILAKHQEKIEGSTLLISVPNTLFYLERSIQRFLNSSITTTVSRELYHACLILLDAMIDSASSTAFYLREKLNNLKISVV